MPAGASTSWALTRNWSPARIKVAVSTASTSNLVASAFRSGAGPVNPAAANGERTTIESSADNEAVSASAKPIASISVSGSAGNTRNGSTTKRVTATARAISPECGVKEAARTAAAMSAAVW